MSLHVLPDGARLSTLSPAAAETQQSFSEQAQPAAAGWDVANLWKGEQEACPVGAFSDPLVDAKAAWRRE